MTSNSTATAREITDDVRATIGSGRSVHRAFIGSYGQVFVSCGAAARAGGSRPRLTSNTEITCRKCLA